MRLGQVRRVIRPPQGGQFSVYRVNTSRGRFIRKTGGSRNKTAELERESFLLDRLGPLFTPFVPTYVGRVRRAFYFSYLPGVNGADVFGRAGYAERWNIAVEFGVALRRVHTWIPSIPYPDNDWLAQAIAQCMTNAARGDGPLQHPQNPFDGYSVGQMADQLQEMLKHEKTDLVFSHGDWCLPNVLLQNGSVTGVIDWSNGGWKDRRFDIATGLRTLRRNTGNDPGLSDYHDAFLRGYGFAGQPSDLRLFEAMYVLL